MRRFAYRAFGEEVQNTGAGDAPPYTYTGKELDGTGLLYYGARYYDPVLCRFTTADSVYDRGPQGLNRYSYALNNPLLYRDPTGQFITGPERDLTPYDGNPTYMGPGCDGCVTGPIDESGDAMWYHEIDPDTHVHRVGRITGGGEVYFPPTTDEERLTNSHTVGRDWNMILAFRDPELRVYRPNWWRTNALSTKAGELLMITPFFIHSNLNPISGEYYSPGKAFDARVGTFLDIGSFITGIGAARMNTGLGGTYLSTTMAQKDSAFRVIRGINPKHAMGLNWCKTYDFIQKLPGPFKSIGIAGFKVANLAHYAGASKLIVYGDYPSTSFIKWEERIVRFFGGIVEYMK